MTEFLSRQERSQSPHCASILSLEKMKTRVVTHPIQTMLHIMRQRHSTGRNHTNESSVSPKTANFPLFSVTTMFLQDTADSEGLQDLSMYVKSSGYGTSTVVETKGATDTFAGDMESENVEVSWTLRHHFAIRSRTVAHQVGRKCEIQTSKAKQSSTITSEQRIIGKQSKNSYRDK